LTEIPVIGTLFFRYNWLVYFAIIVAVILGWFLNKTRKGLSLRAVGESPATADSAGINVTRYKYIATTIGGGLCGVGRYVHVYGQSERHLGHQLCQRLRMASDRTRHLFHMESAPRHLFRRSSSADCQ